MLPPINATSLPDRHINLCVRQQIEFEKSFVEHLTDCVWSPPLNAGSLYRKVRK